MGVPKAKKMYLKFRMRFKIQNLYLEWDCHGSDAEYDYGGYGAKSTCTICLKYAS